MKEKLAKEYARFYESIGRAYREISTNEDGMAHMRDAKNVCVYLEIKNPENATHLRGCLNALEKEMGLEGAE